MIWNERNEMEHVLVRGLVAGVRDGFGDPLEHDRRMRTPELAPPTPAPADPVFAELHRRAAEHFETESARRYVVAYLAHVAGMKGERIAGALSFTSAGVVYSVLHRVRERIASDRRYARTIAQLEQDLASVTR